MRKVSKKKGKKLHKIPDAGTATVEGNRIGFASNAIPRNLVIIAALVAIVTFAVFLPALQNGFINWDDDLYVYENPHIRSLDFGLLKWSFTDTRLMWDPLT